MSKHCKVQQNTAQFTKIIININKSKCLICDAILIQTNYYLLKMIFHPSIHLHSYSPGGVQAREMEWGPDTVTLWGDGIPVGHDTGVCITYLSLTPVPPSVVASNSYTYLKRWQGKEGCGESSKDSGKGAVSNKKMYTAKINTSQIYPTFSQTIVQVIIYIFCMAKMALCKKSYYFIIRSSQ